MPATVAVVKINGDYGRAFRDAAATPGNEADIRGSAFFWEAAGRGFWLQVLGLWLAAWLTVDGLARVEHAA